MRSHRVLAAVCASLALSLAAPVAHGEPPIWESDFGAELNFMDSDDGVAQVNLSFSFPFAGSSYSTVFVGVNGGIQLGSLGTDNEIDFDHWDFLEEFLSDEVPSITPFNFDFTAFSLSNSSVNFNDFGDRAVFTWNEVETFSTPITRASFQLTLEPSGAIVFGYNGIFDDGTDFVNDLDGGFVVGVTPGDIPAPTDPGTFDLSTTFTGGTTVHERWCFFEADICGYFGSGFPPDDLSGPSNAAFDLDQRNVVFRPVPNGFAVPEPSAYVLRIAAGAALALSVALRRRRSD